MSTTPLNGFLIKEPIKELTPQGFLQLEEGAVFAIAKASVSKLHDHALFVCTPDPNIPTSSVSFVRFGGKEIKDISMHGNIKNLIAHVLVQDGMKIEEFSIPFEAYTAKHYLERIALVKSGTLIVPPDSKS